jgi:serine/threonine protein kinase
MIYCLNPDCPKPENPDNAKFCINCGTKLLLKERYRAIEPLGRGGSSKTFEAVDQDRLNHPCVIKLFMLPPDQDQKATELFNQEAVRLYELGKHDQIPELCAHFEQDNRLYLVQEFIDGQTLLDELEHRSTPACVPYKESDIRDILADLLPVLKFIHEEDVIHRDIKPANILRRRSDGKLVLIDFGVAKQATGTVVAGKGTMIGTLGYAPVEQLQCGEAYPASDLYALGATCIHLLTGIHPFKLYNPLDGCWIWQEQLPDSTVISPQLAGILDKLLKILVKERYQSALEVLQDLNKTPVELPSQTVLNVPLATERGIDYTKLRDLLAAGKWQEADEETRQKMLEVMGQQDRGYLDDENIEKFPREDLRTINQLWTYYSNDRFGFSVQKRIWIEEGGKPGVYDYQVYEKFGDRVGWRVNNNWKLYSELTFSLDAQEGHLPLGLGIGWGVGATELVGVESAVEVECLFSRVETCKF